MNIFIVMEDGKPVHATTFEREAPDALDPTVEHEVFIVEAVNGRCSHAQPPARADRHKRAA